MIESMVKRSIMWSQGSHGVKEMDHIAKGREHNGCTCQGYKQHG